MPRRPPPLSFGVRPPQRRLDAMMREKVAETARYFEKHRVPGVVYDTSSEVTAKGALVITWTPREAT